MLNIKGVKGREERDRLTRMIRKLDDKYLEYMADQNENTES